MFDRNHPRYPYKSHGQWLKAAYGGVACTILVFFNGIAPFFQRPFDTRRFVADYIGVSFDDPSSQQLELNSLPDPGIYHSHLGLQNLQTRVPYL
jgi:hypothetical protein